MPGPTELIIIFMILLVLFGASRLPRLGEAIGKSIKGLKRGLDSDDDIEVSSKRVAESSSAKSAPTSNESVADAEVVEK